MAINTPGQIAGLATDNTFALQRPIWDANSLSIKSRAKIPWIPLSFSE
jgi:hypothetical protein